MLSPNNGVIRPHVFGPGVDSQEEEEKQIISGCQEWLLTETLNHDVDLLFQPGVCCDTLKSNMTQKYYLPEQDFLEVPST